MYPIEKQKKLASEISSELKKIDAKKNAEFGHVLASARSAQAVRPRINSEHVETKGQIVAAENIDTPSIRRTLVRFSQDQEDIYPILAKIEQGGEITLSDFEKIEVIKGRFKDPAHVFDMLNELLKMLEPDLVNRIKEELFELPLDFSLLTESFITDKTAKIIKLTKYTHNQIVRLKETPDKIAFSTFMQPLIDLDIYIKNAWKLCCFTKELHQNEKIRSASSRAYDKMNASWPHGIYEVLNIYYQNAYVVEKINLHPEQVRLVEKRMSYYKRKGKHLPREIRDEVIKIEGEIETCRANYKKNLRAKSFLWFSEEELRGLPETFYINREKRDGKYKVGINASDYQVISEYAEDVETRKKMYLEMHGRCVEENIPVLRKILELRRRRAELLGYKSHADFVTEESMFKNTNAILGFLSETKKTLSPLLNKDLSDLKETAQKHKHNTSQKIRADLMKINAEEKVAELIIEYVQDPADVPLQMYDVNYYKRLLKAELLASDPNEINNYFPLDKVKNGTFKLYEKILGIKIVEIEKPDQWHDKVIKYSVYNYDHASQTKGDEIGCFYLDLYFRAEKDSDGCAYILGASADISHIQRSSSARRLPSGALICSFPESDLLSHRNVINFFHELGHVFHNLCCKLKINDFNCNEMEADFCEIPAKMLESWCYEPAALEMISAHRESKKPLPADLIANVVKMKNMQQGYMQTRQLLFSSVDLQLHCMSKDEIEKLDFPAFYQKNLTEFLHLPAVPGECLVACFDYLVSGYDAGFYMYLTALVISVDMFESVFKKDVLDPVAGAKFRKLLERGATVGASELLQNFLGRQPASDTFFQQCGVAVLESKKTGSEPSARFL